MAKECLYTLIIVLVFVNTCYTQTPVITTTAVVTLYEDETSDVILTSVTCTDADGDDVVVSGAISPTQFCGNCFVVQPTAVATGNYDIVYYPTVASFDFNRIAEYTVTLTCTDGTNITTEDVVIRLIPNSPPTFDDGLSVTETIPNVRNIEAGTALHTVSVTDPNNDAISFTMTSTPDSSNFQIGISSGVISAVNDLDQECNDFITFEVVISDGKFSNVGPQTISVTLRNANQAPTITNLDATDTVAEDAVVGTSLFNLGISNDDAATTVTMTTSPSAANSFFTLSGTQLQVATALDYENIQIRTANIMFVADDGGCTSPTYTYSLSITDVNEAPNLALSQNPREIYEGDVNHDPSWVVTDEDIGDTHTFSITGTTPSSSPFNIGIESGLIMSTTNYDIDQGANTATVTLTVQITDSGGLTDSVEYIMHFKDTNDNYPAFTSGTQDLFFTITECTASGTSLGSFSATDDDSSFQNNNVLEFSETETSTGGISIAPSGDVILNTALSAGTSVTLNVQVMDNGEHPGSLTSLVGGTVTITSTDCPTTPTPSPVTADTATTAAPATTSTTQANTSSEADSVWWIVLAGILGTIFLALIVFMCITRMPLFCRYAPGGHWLKNPLCNCQGDLCKRKTKPPNSRTQVKVKEIPSKPATGNPPPNGNEGFWKERYLDDDYQHAPNRTNIPEPVDLEAGPHKEALPWRSNSSPFTVGGKDNGRTWATNVNPNYDDDGIL